MFSFKRKKKYYCIKGQVVVDLIKKKFTSHIKTRKKKSLHQPSCDNLQINKNPPTINFAVAVF